MNNLSALLEKQGTASGKNGSWIQNMSASSSGNVSLTLANTGHLDETHVTVNSRGKTHNITITGKGKPSTATFKSDEAARDFIMNLR